MTSKLFSELKIREEILPNRIAIAPMCQYAALSDGILTDWHRSHYLQLAVSGAGMLVIESTAVSADGRISVGDLGLYSEQQMEKMAEFVTLLKKWSKVKIGIQLSHAGRKGGNRFAPHALDAPEPDWGLVSSSPLALTPGAVVPRELVESELTELVACFRRSARYALEAGFDFVEIHMAHGYLLHQFMSPISNKRRDSYGGNFEGRSKFPIEVFREVSKIWERGKFLGARITGTDWLDGGIDLNESARLATTLKMVGADYVCVSSGGIVPVTNMIQGPMFQVPLAKYVKEISGLCTRAVGFITDYEQAESLIASKSADMVAIGRECLRNPRWVWHASRIAGVELDIPHPYRRIYQELFK